MEAEGFLKSLRFLLIWMRFLLGFCSNSALLGRSEEFSLLGVIKLGFFYFNFAKKSHFGAFKVGKAPIETQIPLAFSL